jgi:hypothetical protein
MSETGPPLAWYRSGPPPPPRGRWRWRAIPRVHKLDALLCLTLATLCFSQASKETLYRSDADFYSRLPLGAPTLLAFVASVLILTVVGFAALKGLRRITNARLTAVASAVALLLALGFVRIAYETVSAVTDVFGRPVLLVAVLLLLAAACVRPAWALHVVRRTVFILSAWAILTNFIAVWMLVEVGAGPKAQWVEPARLTTPPPSLRRVVWIVFGGLDQSLTFETRPAGFELPELDRLRRESVYADAALPPAGTTERSMASLITGRSVLGVVPVSSIDLDLRFADGKTAKLSSPPHVFSNARGLGYDTAVVGWHLPYPRILGRSLGAAAFNSSVGWEQVRAVDFGRALFNHWESLVPPLHARRLYAERVSEIGDVVFRAATDGRFGLVLLHLPLPQTPGIYDRATGRLTAWNFARGEAPYLDNLALADRILGELRRGLDRARLDDRTWLVITSDRPGPGDGRVPFLVRTPDGRSAHVDNAFSTMGTQSLVLAILRGSVADTADVVTWLTRHMPPPKH